MLYPSLIESSAAGFGCLALTILAVSCVISFQHQWYVPVSWLLVILSAISLAAIGVIEGGIAAVSFLATYVGVYGLVSAASVFLRLYLVGTDAAAAIFASVIVMAVELVCLLAYQNLLFFIM